MSEEINETSDFDRALEIIEPMVNDSTEDEMVVALIQAGFKFAKAGRVMNQVLQSKGLKLSAKDRYAAVSGLLQDWGFAPETWADVEAAAENIADEVDATTKAQAVRAIKKFAKDVDLELPERPKGGGGGGSRVTAFDRFYAWAVENQDANDDDVAEFVASLGCPEKQAAKYTNRFQGILGFAREFRSA